MLLLMPPAAPPRSKTQLSRLVLALFSVSSVMLSTSSISAAELTVNQTAKQSAKQDASNADIERIEVRHFQSYRGSLPVEQWPQAVQRLNSSDWDLWSLSRFQDALDLSASIARQNNGGGLWDSFSVRGFPGNENMPSGYLINGFNGGRGFSGHRDTSNIEYIEILKGPGSALYGRSEPGGTINIVSKKPQFQPQGSLKTSIGTYDQYRLEGDYNHSLSDQLAFRITGAWQEHGSFRQFVQSDRQVVTPTLLWQPDADSQWLYELEWLKQSQLFDRGIVVQNNNFADLPIKRYLGEPSDRPTEIDATGHQLSYQRQLNRDWQFNAGLGYRDSALAGFSSDAELARARQSLVDDGRTLTRQRRQRDYHSEDRTIRAEFSGTPVLAQQEHHMLFGVDAYDYELYTMLGRFRGGKGSYALDMLTPHYGVAQAGKINTLYENVESQQAYGVYWQDIVQLSAKWQLLAGVRFDDYEQQIEERVKKTVAITQDQKFSPRLGLSYQWHPEWQWYANYAEGFLPLSGTDYAGAAFAPELSQSKEMGLKWQQAQLSATLALFHAEKSNILVSDPVNVGFSATLGAATSQGLELDIATRLGSLWQWQLSYSWVDSATAVDSINPDWGVLVPKGSRLVNVPRHSLSSQVQREFAVAGYTAALGLRLRYQSQRLGDAVDPRYMLPSTTLWGLFASIPWGQGWNADLVLENLLNKHYIQSSYSALWSYPGEPRSAKLSVRYSF